MHDGNKADIQSFWDVTSVHGEKDPQVVEEEEALNELDHLLTQYEPLPDTLIQRTGGDGLHYLFATQAPRRS